MPSIFTRIVNGEIPCHKIAEDEHHIAFLDIMPLVEGHVLVIPKVETDYLFDLDEQSFRNLWSFAYSVAPAIRSAIPCKRIGVAVIGLEVPHAHIHLVPMNHVGDINFTQAKLNPGHERLAEVAKLIRDNF
jgi:histidine triad (HIT) family protein